MGAFSKREFIFKIARVYKIFLPLIFFQYFDTLEICNLTPDSLDESESTYAWHEEHFTGSWVEGESAGGCRNFLETFASNPQFVIHLVDSDDDDDELCTLVFP